jgi:hypothetical protein
MLGCLLSQAGLGQIPSGISQYHGANGLVIFDVTGAAAQMTVERFGNRFLKIGARYGLLCQTFEQNLALVEEAGRTVAALKGEVLDERLLQSGKLAIPGMALHRANRLAIEVHRRNDAGGAGVARPVRIINDHRAA